MSRERELLREARDHLEAHLGHPEVVCSKWEPPCANHTLLDSIDALLAEPESAERVWLVVTPNETYNNIAKIHRRKIAALDEAERLRAMGAEARVESAPIGEWEAADAA